MERRYDGRIKIGNESLLHMIKLGDSNYGDVYAPTYDAMFGDRDDLARVSDVLEDLAEGGPILEFGIGTGRIALPLAARGCSVYGIDNSTAMLQQMEGKPFADRVITRVGDCAVDGFDIAFSLVYIAFSTIYLIHTQERQVETFRNAARHLKVGGTFVVEGFVHDRTRWSHLQETLTTHVEEECVTLRVGTLDPMTQIITMQQIDLTPAGLTLRPNKLRFIYPSEMDLMAQLAGFRLRERWSDWNGSPFTATSSAQIAVYERVR